MDTHGYRLLAWGSSGRRFKSCQPDRGKPALTCVGAGFRCDEVLVSWASGPEVSQESASGPEASQRVRGIAVQRGLFRPASCPQSLSGKEVEPGTDGAAGGPEHFGRAVATRLSGHPGRRLRGRSPGPSEPNKTSAKVLPPTPVESRLPCAA